MLSVGGLFSGIGGWELGLERAGMRVLWHCEADRFCRRVLEHRWPGVPVHADVQRLRGADVPAVDVLCGGFPCQDVSVAGLGAGIDGRRSGLWAHFARLVGELRPRYVLVENVTALLGRGLGRVLGDLAALGLDAEWTTLRASDVGAPHARDRIWIVAYPPRGDGAARDLLGQGEQWRAPLAAGGLHGLALAPGWQPRGAWSAAEPPSPLLVDGVPGLMDEVAALGNALVPQIAQWIGERIVADVAAQPA